MHSSAQAVTLEELLAHRRWVRALARSLVVDRSVADDIEQQAWMAALEKPPRHGRNVRAWLARVVRRRKFDHDRSERRRGEREAQAPSRTSVPRPDDLVSLAETQARIARAVLALDEPYRATVLLRFFRELSAREIATHQDVPVETVRTRLGRALVQMRGRLERELGTEGDAWRQALLPVAGFEASRGAAVAMGALAMTTKTKVALISAGLLLALLGVGFLLHELTRTSPDPKDSDVSTATLVSRPSGSDASARDPVLRGAPGALDARNAKNPEDAATPRAAHAGDTSLSQAGTAGSDAVAASPEGVRFGEPAPPGVISGAVLDDEGRPLVGALLLLAKPPGRSVAARCQTDETGRFHFDGLDDEIFVVTVQLGGWARTDFTTRPGQRLLDITLARGLTISGRVVQEGTDSPVPGLFLQAVEGGGGAGATRVWTRSAKDGSFVLGGLRTGPWTLTAGMRGGMPKELKGGFVRTHVGAVEAGTKNLEIELMRGFDIEGEIHGPDGEPWTAGAKLRVVMVDVDGHVDYAGRRYAKADDQGRFRATGLPRGRYDLTVTPKEAPDDAWNCAVVHLAGIPAGTTGLVVNLVAGQVLRGRLVDERGEPVTTKGWVWVTPVGKPTGSPGSVSAKILDGGRFETTPLDSGLTYDIRAGSFPGYGNGALEGVHVGSEVVVLELPRGFSISGRVVDAQGRPAPAGVPVTAHVQAPRRAPGPAQPWEYAFTNTDAEGLFAVSGLRELPYTLKAGGSTSGWLSLVAPTGVVAPAEDVTLTIERGVAFSGRLVNAQGDGVPFVSLYVPATAAHPSQPVAQTRRDGTFGFVGVPAGTVRIKGLVDGTYVDLGEHEAPGADVTLTMPP